jgi:glycosyltransferase involved in cell wall biosynthesis
MTRPIRVLHLIEDLGSGGAERLMFTNLSRLNRQKFDGIVCHLYDRNYFWNEPIRKLGYPVYCLGMNSIYDLGYGLIRLMKLLRKEPVDLIHTHLYGANLIGRVAGWLRGIRVLSSIHCPDYDPCMLVDNPVLSRRKLAYLCFLDRLTCKLADPDFLAVSVHIRDYVVQYLRASPGRISVIYNAIDYKAFVDTPDATVRFRAEFGLAPDVPVIVCVARINPQKGTKYLLEAVPIVSARFPDVHVFFVGAVHPQDRQVYLHRAEELGIGSQVHLCGIQPDVRPYLRLCDVFVLPSIAEGFGISVVEAMAMERACVATQIFALPEVIADGRSGILVEPMDPTALAKAIIRLLENAPLRARMGAEGRKIVQEKFDVGRTVPALESLYVRLCRADPHIVG